MSSSQNNANQPRGLVIHPAEGMACIIRVHHIAEATFRATLTRPPTAPAILEGFLNVGGRAVPVMSLARLTDLSPADADLYTPMLLLHAESNGGNDDRSDGGNRESAGSLFGLIVWQTGELRDLPDDQIVDLPPDHTFNNCSTHAVKTEAGLCPLLDPSRVLLEIERHRVEALREFEQRRLDALVPA